MPASPFAAPDSVAPGSLRAWAVAARPKTLWIAAIPVAVATGLAWLHGAPILGWVTALALAGSLVVQVLSNLQNDVGYTARGLETGGRVGLPRATAKGWLTPQAVRRAIGAGIVASALICVPLVAHAGWIPAAIGLVSTAGALAYMGGPRPIAYTPFGEATVFVFFGLVAVLGTYYLHAGTVVPDAWLAGAAVGAHASAVLAVNNHRDHDHDARTGRRTFAATFGPNASAVLYAAAIWLPFAIVAALAVLRGSPGLAAPLVLVPWAARLQRDFGSASGLAYNAILFRTVKLELAFGLAFTAGAVAQRLLFAA
jgi:1,4-dihydroxy-2-naphthoate octaprenyltransferase